MMAEWTWTREAHLEWAKIRALELVDRGDVAGAWASFRSDLLKWEDEEPVVHPAILKLGDQQYGAGLLSDPSEMRRWIEGFN